MNYVNALQRAGHLIILLAILSVCSGTLIAQKQFDYDRKASLDIKEIGVQQRGSIAVRDITYASPKGGVVPAYLVIPSGAGPFPAVIWGHWYWTNSPARNRTEFLDEAVALAQSGVVSLLPDGPIARPGHVENNEPLNEQQITDLVQAVVDMRRGVNVLFSRKEVDHKRLAYVGHSYNAMVGAILSGIDRRFKAFVLMAGGLSDEIDLKSAGYQAYRKEVGADKFDAFIKKYAWTDPGKYVSQAAPAFVFMQFATQEDSLTPVHVRQYEPIVSSPKRFKLYEAPHALNAEARRDRLAFLAEQLKVKPLPAEVIAKIPDLYQPLRPGQ
jgi:dienelactone hydrolase